MHLSLRKLFSRVVGAVSAADTLAEWKRNYPLPVRVTVFLLRFIVFTLGLAVGCAVIAGQFHSYSWRLDPLSQLVPQAFILLLICILSLVLEAVPRGRFILPLLLAPFLLSCAWIMAGPCFMQTRHWSPDKDLETYRIVSINLKLDSDTYDKTASFIRKCNPDFVVFTEYGNSWRRELELLLSEHKWRYVRVTGEHVGIGIYSKYPAEFKVVFVEEPKALAMPVVCADISISGKAEKKLRLIGFRGPSPRRDFLYRQRNAVLMTGVGFAEEGYSTDIPVIMAGDYNASPYSSVFKEAVYKGHLGYDSTPFAKTWPVNGDMFLPFGIRIDHALVNRHVRIISSETGPLLDSDHYPVTVDFQLP